MQQMEGFQYPTALYINMEYYTIIISSESQDMTTIVTEFGRFRCNPVLMGMFTSGHIFQSEVDKLIGYIKGVKTCINGILVLSREILSNNIEQLRIIFGILRTVGLKVDSPKCNFGLKDIPYLFYAITGEGIKPDPWKVQGVMDLGRPTTTTESRALVGVVQYYRDMWPRQSRILAPMPEVHSSPKGRKILWNDAL